MTETAHRHVSQERTLRSRSRPAQTRSVDADRPSASRPRSLSAYMNTATSAHGQGISEAMVENRKMREDLHDLENAKKEVMLENEKLRRLIEELKNKLDKLSGENDKLEYFRSESHNVKKAYRKAKQLNHELYEQNVRFDSIIKHVCENHVRPYAAQNNLQLDTSVDYKLYQHLAQILSDASDASYLRSQLQLLQKELLADVKKVQSVPDEEFCKAFGQLASSIKTLSRRINIGPEVDLMDIDLPQHFFLVEKVPKAYWNARGRRKAMIEACIWSTLVGYIFAGPFRMFGSTTLKLESQFADLFGQDHAHQWPIPTEFSEQWKSSTLEQIVNIVGENDILNGPANLDSHLRTTIRETRTNIRSVTENVFGHLSQGTNFSGIEAITDKAIALALQMFRQRSRLQIVWPHIGESFVMGETTHLATIPECEDVEEGHVVFIVNPGLAKWGDAHGKNLETRFDIMPSQVFVEPLIEPVNEANPTSECAVAHPEGVELPKKDNAPTTGSPDTDQTSPSNVSHHDVGRCARDSHTTF